MPELRQSPYVTKLQEAIDIYKDSNKQRNEEKLKAGIQDVLRQFYAEQIRNDIELLLHSTRKDLASVFYAYGMQQESDFINGGVFDGEDRDSKFQRYGTRRELDYNLSCLLDTLKWGRTINDSDIQRVESELTAMEQELQRAAGKPEWNKLSQRLDQSEPRKLLALIKKLADLRERKAEAQGEEVVTIYEQIAELLREAEF